MEDYNKFLNFLNNNYSDEEKVKYCSLYANEYYSRINRPCWDEYFLNLAFNISTRSEDPNVKHGAVIVNEYNHIIGTGYNGPIKGSDNSTIPFHIRDEKRKWMIHAEENAMLNVTQSSSERGRSCKIYITGMPCNNCLQRVINFGINKIIIADRKGSITENEDTERMRNELIRMSGIELRTVAISNPWVQKSFFDFS
jgi:dCMP deaminase